MGTTLDELSDPVDIVLFDRPPVLGVANVVILGTRVGGVLLVNDGGHTRRSKAHQSAEKFRRVRANVLGVVLKRLSPSRDGYHNQYYYESDDGESEKSHRWLPWLRHGVRSQEDPGRSSLARPSAQPARHPCRPALRHHVHEIAALAAEDRRMAPNNSRVLPREPWHLVTNFLRASAGESAEGKWSIVYGMSTGEVHVAMGRQYDDVHTLHLGLVGGTQTNADTADLFLWQGRVL